METTEYRVVQFLSPGSTRHSGAIADIGDAIVTFSVAVEAAKADTSIKRVALYRYTGTRTECLDDWFRLGGRACKLRHEVPALRFNPAQAA